MKKLIFAAALFAAASVISCDHKNNSETSGWELVWEENFNGDTVDSTVWSRIDRGTSDWNNYMSKADTLYALRAGNLILRGIANYPGERRHCAIPHGRRVLQAQKGIWQRTHRNPRQAAGSTGSVAGYMDAA